MLNCLLGESLSPEIRLTKRRQIYEKNRSQQLAIIEETTSVTGSSQIATTTSTGGNLTFTSGQYAEPLLVTSVSTLEEEERMSCSSSGSSNDHSVDGLLDEQWDPPFRVVIFVPIHSNQ